MLKTWLNRPTGVPTDLPRLSLPEPHAGCHPLALTSPGELRPWLEDLPIGNPVKTCRQLAGQLGLLVRYPAPIARLPALLALLEPQTQRWVERIENRMGEELDTTEQVLFDELIPAFANVNQELGHLYKRQVNALLDGGRGDLADAVHGALQTLARQVRFESSGYHAADPGIWRDLLHLHRIADLLDLTHETPGRRGDGIHRAFFATVLYQLADPLRLPTSAGWALWHEAEAASTQAGFSADRQCSACLRIDASGTMPPLAAARAARDPPAARVLRLPLQPLLESDEAAASYPHLAELLRALGRPGGPARRRHPRLATRRDLRLYHGLIPVHRRLWTAHGTVSGARHADLAEHSAPEIAAAPAAPYLGTPCRQVDESASGVAVLAELSRHSAVQVGDLVLLEAAEATDESADTVLLARVRRLLRREYHRIEIGVEKIDGSLAAAQIRDQPHDGQVIVNRTRTSGQVELYGASGRLSLGCVVELEGPGGPLHVRVDAELERLPQLARVRVTRID